MFDRLLDQIAVSSEWKTRRTPRPPGADAGFLTALQHVMRAAGNQAKGATDFAPVTYVYNIPSTISASVTVTCWEER